MANTGEPQAYLAEEQRDNRGNATFYDWCFAEDDQGVAVEYALTSIRYSAFEGEEPLNEIVFNYEKRDDHRVTFAGGMQLQQSLQLSAVQMLSNGELVREYDLRYAPSDATGRALLQSVQVCAGNSECFAPTQFHYREPEMGFEDIATDIDAPLSDKASPMFFDLDHDGLAEYVV